MALHFNFDFFSQAFIVLSEDFKYFLTTEMIRNLCTLGKGLAQLGAGQNNAVFLVMRACSQGCHAVTLIAVECPVDLQRLTEEAFARIFRFWNLIKNGLGIKKTVEVTDTGMVAADQHTVNTVVLAEGCMQQAFTGTGISHIKGVTALENVVF